MTERAHEPARARWRHWHYWLLASVSGAVATQAAWLGLLLFGFVWATRGSVAAERWQRLRLVAPAVISALFGLWLIALAIMTVWSGRGGESGRRWRQRLLVPLLALLLAYDGVCLASLPHGLARAQQIGDTICTLAQEGALNRITTQHPPLGLANIGPDGARKLREMQRYLGPGCHARVRPGSFESYLDFGGYVLVLDATGEPASLTLQLYLHPIWTPINSRFFKHYGPHDMTYEAFISGDLYRNLI